MKQAQKALIYKDVKEVFMSKQMLVPLLIVPIIFAVIFPIGILVMANFEGSIKDIEPLIKLIGNEHEFTGNAQLMIYIGMNYIFPVFFLLIPLMSASVIGAGSFVVEKERKTLETLMYTPISIKEIFTAKVLGTTVTAYIVTLMAFLLFGLVMNIGGIIYFEGLIFPTVKWIILMVLLVPAITLFGVAFMVKISVKSESFQEAQQKSGFIVLPIIFLAVGQITGLFLVGTGAMILISVILYSIDYLMIKNADNKITL